MKAALVFMLAATAATAVAAPVIEVRARTRLAVDTVTRTGSGVHVRGTLTDASTGEGVTGRYVQVQTDGASLESVVTGVGGRFDAYVDLPVGAHAIGARFVGDGVYGDATFDPRPFDVDKATLALEIRVDGPVDVTATRVVARIVAASPDGPEQVRIAVRAGDAVSTAALRPVQAVITDARGEATVDIPREPLGRPGEKRVAVRFEGSDALNPAEAETTFFLSTTTQLADLRAPTEPVAFENDVELAGRLTDAEGQPVGGALVVLRIGTAGRRVAEAVTDGKGGFALRVAAADLGAGSHTFTVAYDSTTPWRRGARSAALEVQILAPRPVPVSYTLLTFALTLGAVAVYVLLRTRPWRRLVEAWSRGRRKPEAAAATIETDADSPAPGLKLARPGIMQTLRRAADTAFTGRVCDAVRGHSVAGARLVLELGDQRRELVADAHGHFETELTPGWWKVDVIAPGYVTEVVKAPIPHRGELRGARIDLLPVKEKVFAIYRQVAAPLLPRPELWGLWTPREILDHMRGARPDGAFGNLTALVEEAYFSVRVPDESIVAVASAGASAARAELSR